MAIVLTGVPIQQFYAFPYDRWEGYEDERIKLLQAAAARRNVVFLSTDAHGNFVNDARLRTLEDGGPVNSGVLDFAIGPVATETFAQKMDRATGRQGAGQIVEAAFFRPQPPDGLGMRCANVNAYAYAEVEVGSKSVRVTPKDSSGNPLKQGDGSACGPFTVPVQ
jgi:phosphodiesterase/alkaline phosphatase D-like protein